MRASGVSRSAGSKFRPSAAAQLVPLLVDRASELRGRDRAAVDVREVAAAREPVERLDPEERERRDQDQPEQDLQQTLVLADEFEHG